jgi:hypothetical protein
MTDVNKTKTTLVTSEAEARTLYRPPQPGYTGKVGLEVEMPLYAAAKTEAGARPRIPCADEMAEMQKELKARGYDAQLEPAGVLEYASPPVPVAEVAKLVRQAHDDIEAFEQAAAAHGYARAPFCVMPTTSLQEALDNHVGRERLEALIAAMPEGGATDVMRLSLLTTGVQTSFSPQDDEELFRMARRGYMLTPLLLAAMASSSGFAENDNKRQDIHLRGKYYEGYGTSGGLSQAFLRADGGESLIRNHVTEVFDAPMPFCYDAEGHARLAPAGQPMTFRSLAAEGLNTLSNYELAETFLYHDIKIANLRDTAGAVVGKRVEVRAADSGLHQPFSALLLTAALVPDGQTAAAFDTLLHAYGFSGDPRQDAPLLQASRDAAVRHQGRFMDVAFGTGNLRDFAADVAGLVSKHYAQEPAVTVEVAKLVEVLMTGESDAKRYAASYRTLDDVANDLCRKAPKAGGRTGPQ